MSEITVDQQRAEAAIESLFAKLAPWVRNLLDFPGLAEWKREAVEKSLLYSLDPLSDIEPVEDFTFPPDLVRQHELVQGFYSLYSARSDVAQTSYYFRRFPFRSLPVTRAEHMRTCVELFYSRVFVFRERLERQLKWLSRRTLPKGLPVEDVMAEFSQRFKDLINERNGIHHDAAYSDFQIAALGLGDLLAEAGEPAMFRMRQSDYNRLSRSWQNRVKHTADALTVWCGVVALIMLSRCSFLSEPAGSSD